MSGLAARKGKIARLPCACREEVNRRLEQAEPAPKLLAWLNALPEVQKVLREEFDGVPISEQNLSRWRQGGFQEAMLRQDLWVNLTRSLSSQVQARRPIH